MVDTPFFIMQIIDLLFLFICLLFDYV